jgi:hypothetical protein
VYTTVWGVPPFDANEAADDMRVFTWSGREVVATPMPPDLAAVPLLSRQLGLVVKAIQVIR